MRRHDGFAQPAAGFGISAGTAAPILLRTGRQVAVRTAARRAWRGQRVAALSQLDTLRSSSARGRRARRGWGWRASNSSYSASSASLSASASTEVDDPSIRVNSTTHFVASTRAASSSTVTRPPVTTTRVTPTNSAAPGIPVTAGPATARMLDARHRKPRQRPACAETPQKELSDRVVLRRPGVGQSPRRNPRRGFQVGRRIRTGCACRKIVAADVRDAGSAVRQAAAGPAGGASSLRMTGAISVARSSIESWTIRAGIPPKSIWPM